MIISVLTALLIPFALGFFFLEIIGQKERNSLLMISLSWPIGWGMLTLLLFIFGFLGLSYNVLFLHMSLTIIIIILFVSRQIIKSRQTRENPAKEMIDKPILSFYKIIFMSSASIFLIYYLCYVLILSLNIPIFAWDSVSTSVYNAKILFYEQSLSAHLYFAHSEFPVGFPIMIAWINFNLGMWDDQLFKIFFSLTFTFFLLFQYEYMKTVVSRRWALGSVLLLLTSNLVVYHSTVSYRDIVIMPFICGAVCLLSAWLNQAKKFYLLSSMLLIGCSIFIKSEGLAYLLIYFISFVMIAVLNYKTISRQLVKDFVKFALIPISIVCLYALYSHVHHIPSSPITKFSTVDLWAKTSESFIRFFHILFFTANYNFLWAALILSLIFNANKVLKSSAIQLFMLYITLFIGLHFSLSVLSVEGWRIISLYTISRLFVHILPLVAILIVLLNVPKEELTTD